MPVYSVVFSSAELEKEATELCGEDHQCLFDVAATGRLDIGLSTLTSGNLLDEIIQLQIPGDLKTLLTTLYSLYICDRSSLEIHIQHFLWFVVLVVCSTQCGNGVCVANDTCYCASGYGGEYCTEPGTLHFI